MRSVSYVQFGEASQVLEVIDRGRPEPGRGQVRIKLVLSPIHNHDLMTIKGVYGVKPTLPAVPGTEAVGVVDALGAGVSNLDVGQRVMGGANEAWAEYYLADASRVIPVPEGVDDDTACQLISMPLSAKMLLADLDVQTGDWIIQNAANGAVGKLLNQFARAGGIHVVNLVRRDEAVAEMTALGFDNTVSTQNGNWREAVKALTGGAPIIRGLDSLGGDGPESLLSVAADGAEIISFGNLSGRNISLSSDMILFKQATVRGFWGAKPRASTEAIGRMMGELVSDAARGKLKLSVDGVYALDQVREAVAASAEPGRTGKVVIKGT